MGTNTPRIARTAHSLVDSKTSNQPINDQSIRPMRLDLSEVGNFPNDWPNFHVYRGELVLRRRGG
jgi:hypothetical protein